MGTAKTRSYGILNLDDGKGKDGTSLLKVRDREDILARCWVELTQVKGGEG